MRTFAAAVQLALYLIHQKWRCRLAVGFNVVSPEKIHALLSPTKTLGLALCMLAITSQGCVGLMPLYHSAKPIEGRIVDFDTDSPIQGVIVTANWQLEGGTNDEQMMVYETTSDASGFYRFPAWGPIARPLDRRLSSSYSPKLVLFKPGYLPIVHIEDRSTDTLLDAERDSQWNKKTIRLTSVNQEDRELYKKSLEKAVHALLPLIYNDNCDIRKIKKMVNALIAAHAMSPLELPTNCPSL